MNTTNSGVSNLSSFYSTNFYEAQADGSRRSAQVLVPLLLARRQIASVVDVGCGVGTWLSAFSSMNISDIQGYDGDYVDRSKLEIPESAFKAADLTQPLLANRRFDLAVCLEVGEHLPSQSAPTLVKSLVGLADVVLFSAAIPGQSGTNHVNEQWPEFWAKLFADHGYRAIDCIRPLIWHNPSVEWWYAQNIILYVSETAIKSHPRLAIGNFSDGGAPMRLIHPTLFEAAHKTLISIRDQYKTPGVLWSIRALACSIGFAIKRRLPWTVQR